MLEAIKEQLREKHGDKAADEIDPKVLEMFANQQMVDIVAIQPGTKANGFTGVGMSVPRLRRPHFPLPPNRRRRHRRCCCCCCCCCCCWYCKPFLRLPLGLNPLGTGCRYVDDQGVAKQLPVNRRASMFAAECGMSLAVNGDAFLARTFDDEDNFERIDFT